jgi:hypothetical protein
VKRCPKCGSQVNEGDIFCGHCGTRLVDNHYKKTEYDVKSAERNTYTLAIALFVILVLLIFIVYAVNTFQSSSSKNQQSGGVAESGKVCRFVTIERYYTTTTWTTTTNIVQKDLINDKIVIDPSSYAYYTLMFDTDTVLKGYFEARGGSGNDIKVTLYTDVGFTNFQNGHPDTSYYYKSGKVTTDRFTLLLPPGTYYLVLDNGFSAFSNKVVTIYVSSEHEEVVSYPVPVVNTHEDVQYVCD